MSLVQPLVAASDTLPAVLLAVLVCQILWFAGIHGALIVTGIMNPFWMANLSVNQAAMAAGEAIPHIFVQGFWDHYLLIGGVGSTLPLAFLLMRSRAIHLRTIGKMGSVPAIFNINEPILFGAPIIMNSVLPAIHLDPYGQRNPSLVCPRPRPSRARGISNALDNTWTYRGILGSELGIQSCDHVLHLYGYVAIMYLPFLKAYEKQLLDQEAAEEEKQATSEVATA
ncbi:PTS system [Vibrio ishigakensis]|uniref:PTS system n=1 Tax=Vibrio ishigakensis TaxID=1481914 RepID=A0A0B8QIR1_9VIBR|nr:PTS system [Vibrio ishigakensis]